VEGSVEGREVVAARSALDAAGRAAGLDTAAATVARAGASTVFRLPASGWLARVAPPGPGEGAARREVTVATVLAGAGVPAVRLAPVPGQPLVVPGGVVTVWEDAGPLAGTEASPDDLGRLARCLHDATAGSPALAALPALDPPAAAADRLAQAESAGTLAPPDAAVLWHAHRRLAAAWAAMAPAPRPALVHGDLHPANVLVTADGPVLADLELSGVGDPAYDLAPSLVAIRRYGRPPAHHERFAAAYGADVRDHPHAAVLCEVYELWVTAWSVAAAGAGPVLAEEAAIRIATWRGEPTPRPWTLY
jgi:aminoglycoside phosphotransferase (APT) family kinase protein